MKNSARTRNIFILSVVVLSGILGAYMYMFKYMATLETELADLVGEVGIAEALARNREATEHLLKETEFERNMVSNYFVSTTDPTAFLELIESSARDAGVALEVKSIQVESGEEPAVEKLKKVTVVLSTTGGWRETYHLLSLLENLPYVAHIARATVTLGKGASEGMWDGMIHLECEGV